jgi:membrane protein DedA with SNARE-associated domain
MAASGEQASVIIAIFLVVFLAQALKEIGIPSPGLSQSLLVYAGYEVARGAFLPGFGIIGFTLGGSLCGAYLMYCLARFGGSKLFAKINRYARISPEALEKAGNKIKSHSSISVAIGRSIPGLMVPISIVAGTLKMPLGRFVMGIVFPLSVWMAVLAGMGSGLQNFTPQINVLPKQLFLPVGVLVAGGILAGILRKSRQN